MVKVVKVVEVEAFRGARSVVVDVIIGIVMLGTADSTCLLPVGCDCDVMLHVVPPWSVTDKTSAATIAWP